MANTKKFPPYDPRIPEQRDATEAWLEEQARGGFTLYSYGLWFVSFQSTMPPKALRYRMERTARTLEANQARRDDLKAQDWTFVTLRYGLALYATEDLSKEALPPWKDALAERPMRPPYRLSDFLLRELLPAFLLFALLAVLLLWDFIPPKSVNALLSTDWNVALHLVFWGVFQLILLLCLLLDLRHCLRGRCGKIPPFLHTPKRAERASAFRILQMVLIFSLYIFASWITTSDFSPEPVPVDPRSVYGEALPLPDLTALHPQTPVQTEPSLLEYPKGPFLVQHLSLRQQTSGESYSLDCYDMRTPELAQKLVQEKQERWFDGEPLPAPEGMQAFYRTYGQSASSAVLLLSSGTRVLELYYNGSLDLREHLDVFAPYFDQSL